MDSKIKKIKIYKRKIIFGESGNVMHIMKKNDLNYRGFGEVYISTILFKKIKGWKYHNKMHMNLIVPKGRVRFVFFENYVVKTKTNGVFKEIILDNLNYQMIYVPSKIWFAFQGLSRKESIIINFANITHTKNEVQNLNIDKINYKWK
tara:strand:+ start:5070 stop:5513 length:444 start_codon:yes stop_codon:yes gene_type:complete